MRRRLEAFIPIVVIGGFGAMDGADRGISCCSPTPQPIRFIWLSSVPVTSSSDAQTDPGNTRIVTPTAVPFVRAAMRFSCHRFAPAGFCNSATPVPAGYCGWNCRGHTGLPCRLERPGARATAVDVNCAAPHGRSDVFT